MNFTLFPCRRELTARHSPSPPPAEGLRALLALAFSTAMLSAQAGRPLATDDAAIVDHGACQLETWIERRRDGRGTWLNPGCNPFGRTEFSLGGARMREDGASFTLQQWQIKQMLRDYDATQPGFALAVGDHWVRHGGARAPFLNGMATLPLLGEAHLMHISLGAVRVRDAEGRRSRATWGLAYDTEAAGATRVSLETFGTSGERPNWQLGVRHELVAGHVQLDASVGSAFGRWPQSRLLTVGLVFVSPAFMR